MTGLSEDIVTLTQLNCVQQCSAVIHKSKPRNYLTAAALFGIYCGVLIYRSYRNYQAKMEARIAAEMEMQAEEISPVDEDSIYDAPERPEYPAISVVSPAVDPVAIVQQSNEEQQSITTVP